MNNKDFLIKYIEDDDEVILRAYVGKEKIVEIPESVTTIDKFAFANDVQSNDIIEKIILPSTVLKIEKEALAYCTKLKEIIFNDEVESINFKCFVGCDSLEEVKIPPRIETIITFPRKNNFTKIYVNDNLKFVTEDAFDIYNEEKDEFEPCTTEILLQNPVYKIIDGFMVNTKFMITLYRVDKSSSHVRIPNGIKTIGTGTFDEMNFTLFHLKDVKPIETVVIPASVRRINYNAFDSCENLRSVKYEGKSASLSIDEDAFYDCKQYTEHENLIECSDIKFSGKSKKITHLMLERFKVIHKKINSGTYPNTENLRQACIDILGLDNKLSIATISRDLEYLRNSMEAPIEYNRYENGYYYTEEFELKL